MLRKRAFAHAPNRTGPEDTLSTYLRQEDASNKRHLCDDSQTLYISVIVPVRNEAQHIQATLTQLVTQDYDSKRFEIIVVDGESTDETPALAREFVDRYENVRLLPNPRRLSSAARNIGIRQAHGDVVVIVDGHCEIPTDQMLWNAAKAFQTSGADCLGRPQPLDVSRATTLQRAIAAARSSWLGHHPDSYIYSSEPRFVPAKSVAVAYRRSVFDQVGYFDESFDACEDYEFNHRVDRAGLRCFFTPDVAVRYRPRGSLRGLFRQLVRYGRGRVRLARKHPETLGLGSLVPTAFVAGVATGWTIALISWILAAVYFGILTLYAAIVLATSVLVGVRQRRLAFVWILPPVFLTIHCACGWGALAELLCPRDQFENSKSTPVVPAAGR